jgi:hypothetical protein
MPWQNVFETLKEHVSQEPVLMAPDLARPFEMEVDASSFAIGAVLSQQGDDGQLHPIAFYSATFTPKNEIILFMTENSLLFATR